MLIKSIISASIILLALFSLLGICVVIELLRIVITTPRAVLIEKYRLKIKD